MQTEQEFISAKIAKKVLGDEAYFAFCAWLRTRGYDNLTQIGESHFKHEIFATKDQLNQFLSEQGADYKRSGSITQLFGQTRELLKNVVNRGRRK